MNKFHHFPEVSDLSLKILPKRIVTPFILSGRVDEVQISDLN